MRCFFKKHIFHKTYDQIIGGIIGRHVECKNCKLEYALWWHLEKPHKPIGKTIRVNISAMLRAYPI
jgi:hypothetical protein